MSRFLLVTHTAVQVFTDEGVLSYTHGIKINEPVSFVFPVDSLAPANSDVLIRWDVDQDIHGAYSVYHANCLMQGKTTPISSAGISHQTTYTFPKFSPIPTVLTSVIPSLSKYMEKSSYGAMFPGVIFTKQSAFATDGKKFASWSDSTLPSDCVITFKLVESYREIHDKYSKEENEVCAKLYEQCISSPEDYWEYIDIDDISSNPAEWLDALKEEYPSAEDFVNAFGQRNKSPVNFPMSFPKYLDKMLEQNECCYGFDIQYTDAWMDIPLTELKMETDNPSDVVFFLSTSTYGGRELTGQLIWYTFVRIHNSVKSLDAIMFDRFVELDKSLHCPIPVSVFNTFKQLVKKPKKGESTVAFTNHDGMLGIGVRSGDEIMSTPTTVKSPRGLVDYVTLPYDVVSIPIPSDVAVVTIIFEEDDNAVFVVVGNMMYCYLKLDTYEGGERVKLPIKKLNVTPVKVLPTLF